jgi:hypothetical protein
MEVIMKKLVIISRLTLLAALTASNLALAAGKRPAEDQGDQLSKRFRDDESTEQQARAPMINQVIQAEQFSGEQAVQAPEVPVGTMITSSTASVSGNELFNLPVELIVKIFAYAALETVPNVNIKALLTTHRQKMYADLCLVSKKTKEVVSNAYFWKSIAKIAPKPYIPMLHELYLKKKLYTNFSAFLPIGKFVRSADQALQTFLAYSDIDINEADENGMTLLHHAASTLDCDLVGKLLKNPATVSNLVTKQGKTALDLVTQREGPEEVINLLRQYTIA